VKTANVHLAPAFSQALIEKMASPADNYTFLDDEYKRLVGQTFVATYTGSHSMPQTSNLRNILVLGVQNPFNATLEAIRSSVEAKCGEKVWKGITCTFWGDVQGHPMDLFLKISVLQAHFCWLGDVEEIIVLGRKVLLGKR